MTHKSPITIWRNSGYIRSLLGKTGKIVRFTVIHVPPGDFSVYGSYPVAIVLLDDGQTGIFQVVDAAKDELSIGKKVRLVLRRSRLENHEDVISYQVKCVLL